MQFIGQRRICEGINNWKHFFFRHNFHFFFTFSIDRGGEAAAAPVPTAWTVRETAGKIHSTRAAACYRHSRHSGLGGGGLLRHKALAFRGRFVWQGRGASFPSSFWGVSFSLYWWWCLLCYMFYKQSCAYMHTCSCTHTHACTPSPMHTYTYTHICICIHVCVCVRSIPKAAPRSLAVPSRRRGPTRASGANSGAFTASVDTRWL